MLRSFIIPALVSTLIMHGQSETAPKLSTYELGFSLNGTTFIYKVFDDSVLVSEPITRKSFIMQGMGVESSRANLPTAGRPADSNLFERFAIRDCGGLIDTTTKEVTYLCFPLDDLPKLTTATASDGSSAFGWSSNNFQPGEGQQRILDAYRPESEIHWLGPYFGERAFRLLHDMQDPDWVARYRSAQ